MVVVHKCANQSRRVSKTDNMGTFFMLVLTVILGFIIFVLAIAIKELENENKNLKEENKILKTKNRKTYDKVQKNH